MSPSKRKPKGPGRWPQGKKRPRVGTIDGVWDERPNVVVMPTPKRKKKSSERAGTRGSKNAMPPSNGRPAKSKNKIPASVHASMRAIIEDVITHHNRDVQDALLEGIQSGPKTSHNFLKLGFDALDGKNTNLNLSFKTDEIEEASRRLDEKFGKLIAAFAPK